MEDFSKYCVRLRKDIESAIETTCSSNLALALKEPIYVLLKDACDYIEIFKINLENPEENIEYKRRVLEKIITPRINRAKLLINQYISERKSIISPIEN